MQSNSAFVFICVHLCSSVASILYSPDADVAERHRAVVALEHAAAPSATSFFVQLWPVGVFSSTFSWIDVPLSVALTMRALAVFLPSASKRGARKIAVSFCHSPGGLQAFAFGGDALVDVVVSRLQLGPGVDAAAVVAGQLLLAVAVADLDLVDALELDAASSTPWRSGTPARPRRRRTIPSCTGRARGRSCR